jgi:co-chaperonin GroES (HSP10)
MKLYPRNRHIVVKPAFEKKVEKESGVTSTGVLLPDDYREKESPYVQAKVVESSPDCSIGVSKGDKVLIQRSMLEEIEVNGNNVYLVLENYIYGVLSDR